MVRSLVAAVTVVVVRPTDERFATSESSGGWNGQVQKRIDAGGHKGWEMEDESPVESISEYVLWVVEVIASWLSRIIVCNICEFYLGLVESRPFSVCRIHNLRAQRD